jgi:hypothetical protein
MCRLNLRNRFLTRRRPLGSSKTEEHFMSDILFLALGLGVLALLALYARGLGRI